MTTTYLIELFHGEKLLQRLTRNNLKTAFWLADQLYERSHAVTHYVISYPNGDSYRREKH